MRIVTAFLFCSVCLCAQNLTPFVQIGRELGAVEDFAVTIDSAYQPVVAFSAEGKILVARGHDGFSSTHPVDSESDGLKARTFPAIVTDFLGTLYVAFGENKGEGLHVVGWTTSPGGHFQPVKVIPGSETRQLQKVWARFLPTGELFFAWWGLDAEGQSKVFGSFDGGQASEILQAAQFDFALDSEGRLYAVYTRGDSLFYSVDQNGDPTDGELKRNEKLVVRSEKGFGSPKIAVTPQGRPYIAYLGIENDTVKLFITGEDFSLIREIANGIGDGLFEVFASERGFSVVFGKGAQIYLQRGFNLRLVFEPQVVGSLSGPIDLLKASEDPFGYVHVLCSTGGALYYSNNCPPPRADFTTDPEPPHGEYPLKVSFVAKSTGHVLQYVWDFGDGTPQRRTKDPEHTYQQVGTYDVKLRVIGVAGAFDEVVKPDLVVVTKKRSHLIIPDVQVYAGQQGFLLPVKATSPRPIQGFQLAATFDSRYLSFSREKDFVDLTFTKSAPQEPEFIAAQQNPQEGWFTVGVIYDTATPITGKAVPPGKEINLINLILDIPSDVPNRTRARITLQNGVGDPPISNIFTVNGGISVYPELHSGTVTIIRPDMEFQGPVFLRGDVNGDGAVSLADAIFTLSYLFAGGQIPPCPDAADFDDDQRINIADAVGLLGYLFAGGSSPKPPFPSPGLDPTPDSLPECSYSGQDL